MHVSSAPFFAEPFQIRYSPPPSPPLLPSLTSNSLRPFFAASSRLYRHCRKDHPIDSACNARPFHRRSWGSGRRHPDGAHASDVEPLHCPRSNHCPRRRHPSDFRSTSNYSYRAPGCGNAVVVVGRAFDGRRARFRRESAPELGNSRYSRRQEM